MSVQVSEGRLRPAAISRRLHKALPRIPVEYLTETARHAEKRVTTEQAADTIERIMIGCLRVRWTLLGAIGDMASPEHDVSPHRRRIAVGAIFLFILCACGFIAWNKGIRPVREHREAYQRLESAINGLTSRRPQGVTREQWSYIVGWTMNGIGNCCAVREFLHDDSGSHQRFVAFVNDLERKVHGEVTIETIDWIWDQFVLVSRYGEKYAHSHRPTTPERLEESAYISTGIEVQ